MRIQVQAPLSWALRTKVKSTRSSKVKSRFSVLESEKNVIVEMIITVNPTAASAQSFLAKLLHHKKARSLWFAIGDPKLKLYSKWCGFESSLSLFPSIGSRKSSGVLPVPARVHGLIISGDRYKDYHVFIYIYKITPILNSLKKISSMSFYQKKNIVSWGW